MAAKAKTSSRSGPKIEPAKPLAMHESGQVLTMEEQLHRIEALGKRIESYVQFMCELPGLTGTSAEVKGRAVHHFYDQLVLVEKQLAHIHDQLRLE